MTPRQRVITALRHQEPDRVPLDLGGTESSGLTAVAYNRLRSFLGLPTSRTQVFDVYQQVVKIEDDMRDQLQIDTVPLLFEPRRWKTAALPDRSPCLIPEKWSPEQEEGGDQVVRNDEGTVIARMPAGGYYFEPVAPPLAAVEDPSQLDAHEAAITSFDWPDFLDESLENVATRARRLFQETDLAVVANLQLHLLAAGQLLRGYEAFMTDLLLNRKLVHALLRRLVDSYKSRVESVLKRIGDWVQVVLVNDDLGTQNGPMLSLDCYKEMVWPYQRELFQFIKSKADVHLLFHSCGSVHRFIPLLIEAGVDALNPVQVSAEGMDTRRLKKRFGKEITFWGGGCDTQQVLRSGPAQRIRDEVRRRIEDLSSGGGFVFTQVHNIQPDVPPKNVMAMLEAFQEYSAVA